MFTTKWKIKSICPFGRGGGQVVSVLVFYSDDQSSNPTKADSISLKFENNENKEREVRVAPFLNSQYVHCNWIR